MTDKNLWSYNAYHLTQDGLSAAEALRDVTDLIVLAHPDDAEISAPNLIHAALGDPNRKVGVIIVTNGEGAPRKGEFENFSNEQLAATRLLEQADAATEGHYHFLAMLQHPDLADHKLDDYKIAEEVFRIARQCPKLETVCTHQPFDYHQGHLSVFAGGY